MKIEKKRKEKKSPLVLIISLLFIAGVAAALFYLSRNNSQQSSDLNEVASVSHESDNQQSQAIKDNPESKTQSSNSDKPATPSIDTTSGKQQVQMTTSYNISDGTVYIRGGINYPVNDGSCYALLTGPSGQSIRKDTTVLQSPASADCKTISMLTSDLTSGKWTYVLRYTSESYEGASDENTFNI